MLRRMLAFPLKIMLIHQQIMQRSVIKPLSGSLLGLVLYVENQVFEDKISMTLHQFLLNP